MRVKFCSQLAIFTSLVVLLFPLSSNGASIRPGNSDHCKLILIGPIASGDAKKLETAIEQAGGAYNLDLCLDSEGGNFSEALLIVQLLLSNYGIGTTVPASSKCIGPCAFVFMAGRRTYHHSVSLPIRRLHINGHLSFLLPKADSMSPANTEAAYREGVKIAAALGKENGNLQANYRDPLFPFPRLLIADLLQNGSNANVVDTIAKSGRYGIDLIGYDVPDTITKLHLFQGCLFHSQWGGAILVPSDGLGAAANAIEPPDPVVVTVGQVRRLVFQKFGRKSNLVCVADIYRSPKKGYHVDFSIDESLKKNGKDLNYFKKSIEEGNSDKAQIGLPEGKPLWTIFQADTKIEKLKR